MTRGDSHPGPSDEQPAASAGPSGPGAAQPSADQDPNRSAPPPADQAGPGRVPTGPTTTAGGPVPAPVPPAAIAGPTPAAEPSASDPHQETADQTPSVRPGDPSRRETISAAHPPTRPRRRGKLVVASAVTVALAFGIAGLVAARPGPLVQWLDEGDASPSSNLATTEPAPPPVLADLPDAPMPTAEGLRAALDNLVNASELGDRVHVAVQDVATGTSLYTLGGEVGTVPASTTKVVTAAAVLAARGPAYRIPTRVVAGATPGEVVLVGGGDPTLAVAGKGTYAGAARLDQLAAQTRRALGMTPTKVTVDSTLFSGPVYGPGWDDDIPTGGCASAITAVMTDGGRVEPKAPGCSRRHSQPDIAAGKAFAKALGVPDEVVKAVKRGSAPASGAAPADGTPAASASPDQPRIEPGVELARVESPPVIRLVEFMLLTSDNVVAEALARQVALARGQPASFAGAAQAMAAVLAELGLPATEATLADGSGLSRTNRISPSFLTELLVLAASGTRPELTGLFAGLPVSGWSGTLKNRYASEERADEPAGGTAAGAGVVRAKTGTLTGVSSLSGVVMTADGRLLAFAVMADKVPAGSWSAELALDRIVARLATCGCR